MKTTSFLFAAFLVAVVTGSVVAQFPQVKRNEELRQAKIRAEEERQRAEKNGTATSVGQRPVTNVDVQMVLTKLEYKTFADAKPNSLTRIADGDPVWLYLRFKGKLDRYVYRMPSMEVGERYLLFVEFGPSGGSIAKSHEILEFSKDELELTELKLSLSPGKAGHNRSLGIYFKNVATATTGLWNNEIRFASVPAFPLSPNDYLARAGFINDFSKGVTKYSAAKTAYRSMVLRDTTDESKLPVEGRFDDTIARTDLVQRLAEEGIAPSRIYFSNDFWLEYSDLPTSVRQFRTVTGTFLYRRGTTCLYGTADIIQTYDAMNKSFGESKIKLEKDFVTACR